MNRIHTKEKYEDGYTAIIGHRRRDASEIAGLTELPCVITEMTEQEQIATMLLENMQRSDLTVYEQAQGMQMMMDFGESITSISEKTGFSETTVRRRIRLMELDQEKLKKVSQRQLSFEDLERLNKIYDIDVWNKVLGDIGTNNFESSYRRAIQDQESAKKAIELKELAESYGFKECPKVDNFGSKYNRVAYVCSCSQAEKDKLDKLDSGVEYFYQISYGSLYVYTERTKEEDEAASRAAAERARREDALTGLKEAAKRTHGMRKDFIKNFSKAEAKKILKDMIPYLCSSLVFYPDNFNPDMFTNLLGIDENDDNINAAVAEHPEFALLCAAYSSIGADGSENYHEWSAVHRENEILDEAYEFLKKLGYEMSDEEIALQNGTSELFYREHEEALEKNE